MPCLTRDKLSAAEIIAFDDIQLDEYLVEQGRNVDVKDPNNLTEAFIQRLRDRIPNPKSQPVDLQQLMARLREATAFEQRSVRSFSEETEIYTGETYEEKKQYQIEAYQKLVESGGRPTHPVERMEEIVKDPGELREILSFFQHSDDDWEVYARQCGQWLNFQKIQRYIRQGSFDNESDLRIAVQHDTLEAFINIYPDTVNGRFGFTEYAQLAKERLIRNGITHVFDLDQDPTKQDKLTIWLEYMNWEYIYYEDYAHAIKVGRKIHNKAWRKLVDSGELREGETEEIILTLEHGLQRSAEKHGARAALKAAQHELAQAENSLAFSHVPTDYLLRRQHVDAARTRVHGAEKAAAKVCRRNNCIGDFLHTTRAYRVNTDSAERHRKLVFWMVQQIPLIEQEEEATFTDSGSYAKWPSGEAATGYTGGGNHETTQTGQARFDYTTTSGKKRRRNQSDDDPYLAKRVNRGNDTGRLPIQHVAASTTNGEQDLAPAKLSSSPALSVQQYARSANLRAQRARPDLPSDPAAAAASAGPRRSARILARMQRDNEMIATPAQPRLQVGRSAQVRLPSPPSSEDSPSKGGANGTTDTGVPGVNTRKTKRYVDRRREVVYTNEVQGHAWRTRRAG
ncbi:hypothetical protein EG328_007337 [Venturia inaequalis]|uniref:Uncharacterized protein n=1 Tax=Venturia inaequalis TaxID=5025 RepID=A0A8H3VM06_VENIN|nr:hypothetical protein EG328_007337 [Venturia inaequalis]KAE9990405.1 hypothetical protein EG327_001449 [Venturia inaequalis]